MMAVIGVAAMGLAGCETAGGLLGNNATPTPEVAQAPAVQQQPSYKVALAPIIGAPDGVAKQLAQQLAQTSERQRITVLADRDAKGDYTLRGYIVAARDKAGTKVSYIWDVADGSGKRVHRITGEEIAAAAPNAKDPWAAVTPAALQNITDRTVSALATWLPTQQPAAPSTTPVATAAPQSPAAGAGAGTLPPSNTPVAQAPGRPPAVSNQTTAALPPAGNEQVVTSTPVVTGAPGDGNGALAAAIQRELSRQGIGIGNKPGAYRVEGEVILGQAKDGRQPIQIDWRVKDAQGKSLGTVSQKNEIPPGSLDGQWGKTADAAAAAAAQGIVKLLPPARASN
ncbi:MAG: hypothetical protein ACKVP7_12530 [Hyphomicrobiaceae bacterium]